MRADVRIIAATNRQLIDAVERGEFRADLYYRINTFTIQLPPLRDRHGDVPLLAKHFVNVHAQRLGKSVRGITQTMRAQLERYPWPGNVRELENVVQRALIISGHGLLSLEEPLGQQVGFSARRSSRGEHKPLDLRSAEKAHIESVLDQTGWRISGDRGAAVRLGLPPSTLRSRMKKLGISRGAVAERRH